jgi:hypothetical protein
LYYYLSQSEYFPFFLLRKTHVVFGPPSCFSLLAVYEREIQYTARNSTNQIAAQLIYGEWLYYKMTYIVCESVAWSLNGHVNFPRKVGTNCDLLNYNYAKWMLIHWTLRSQRALGCSKLTVSRVKWQCFIRGRITVVFIEVWRINKKGRCFQNGKLISPNRRCNMINEIKLRLQDTLFGVLGKIATARSISVWFSSNFHQMFSSACKIW